VPESVVEILNGAERFDLEGAETSRKLQETAKTKALN